MEREFVLTNGKTYIHCDVNGKYSHTGNIALAEVFESQSKAGAVKQNCISRTLGHGYYIAEIVDGKIIQCDVPRPPKAIAKKGTKSFVFKNNFASMKWCKNFIGMDVLFADAAKRVNEINQEISDIEGKIIDIEHYIEFNSLNARDGYKIYYKLKTLLRERRVLKNEQKMVDIINKNQAALTQIKKIINAIEEGSSYSYKPRILLDLFENNNINCE